MPRSFLSLLSLPVLILAGIFFCILAPSAQAAPWSGILAPDRARDWSLIGIPGGIPNRTTVCANLTAGASTSVVQTAINNCPAGQVISFGVGTFNLAGIYVNKGITLRGQGPNSTTIVLSSDNIFLGAFGNNWLGNEPPSHTVTSWTGGLTAGSTVLTVGSTAGLSVGQTIILDELNPSWIFLTGVEGSDGSAGRGDGTGGSWFYGSTNRAAPQMTKIVNINGSQITVRDPVIYTHTAGLTPQVFGWPSNLQYAGVEDMRIDANRVEHAIGLMHCDYCWVKNIRVDNVGRSGVTTRYGYGMVLRDSYLSAPPAQGGPTQYGTECYMSSNVLVENNIFWNITDHIQIQNCTGNVYSYNYIHHTVADNLFPQIDTHGAHNQFHLMEGNDADVLHFDNTWGSASHNTAFRNRLNGYGENKTNYRRAISVAAHNRYMNFVANVAGTTGFHTNYQCDNAHLYGSDNYVFDIGFWNNCDTGTTSYDTVATTSLMKWGNWDAATYLANGNANGIRYCTGSGAGNPACSASETASGDPTFPALSSPSTTFPASFYLSSKPTWFGSVPFPPIGPDVTCSSNCVASAANRANKIPARLCYEATAKDGNGNLTAYDARTCYSDSAPDPTPPTVSLTAPAQGATVSGSSVTVSATASDNVGVVGVQFQLDGANLGTEDLSSPYSLTWDTTQTTNASHTLTAIARDGAGNTTTSASRTVTVSNTDPIPPTILSLTSSPASGSFTVGSTLTITTTFSEAVTSTGSVTLTLETGTVDRTCSFTITNASSAPCTYSVQAGDTSSDLTTNQISGTIRDQAGNLLTNFTPASTLAQNAALVIDTTPPTVFITAPTEGQAVSGTQTITASASDNTSIAGVQFKQDGSNLGSEDTASPYSFSWNTTQTTNASHALTATARDQAGNTLTSSAITVTVNNAGDTTPPTLTQVTPIPSVTRDSTPDYTFSSTEAGTLTLSGGCTTATPSVSSGTTVLTLNTLTPGTYATCSLRVTDSSSNPSSPLSIPSFTLTYPSDLNLDRSVNVLDFSLLKTHYGTSNPQGDVNQDGSVNVLDFGTLKAQYGQSV